VLDRMHFFCVHDMSIMFVCVGENCFEQIQQPDIKKGKSQYCDC